MLFPHLSNFHPNLKKTILDRAGNNSYVSSLVPWIRIVSSSGLVLESTPATDSFDLRYGNITKSGRVGTDLSGNSIYADSGDRGFRPSPIIEGLGVNFGAGGLTRKCSFAIKCFTLKQAEKVMEYFLEPGYTVLVEYGWNTRISTSQKIPLTACDIAKFNSYDYVKKKHIDSNFEYDGFMGYITGGNMKSGEGETYTIEVELTSLGDVAMYLQQHRGGNDKDDSSSGSGLIYDTGLIDSISSNNVGYSLWMQMFNRLPKAKQTKEVRALVSKYDDRGRPWVNEENFINMDDEVREKLIEELQNTSAASEKTKGAEIPEGVSLVSESSYIRLALAFEILNTYSSNLESVPAPGCTEMGTYSGIIEYKNTICRASKYMFSHDGSKLLIPNPTAPDFGLVEALSATTKEQQYAILNNGIPAKTISLAQWKDDERYQFPYQKSLSSSEYKWPVDAEKFEAGPGEWGYLKDLYINFEFFIEVLDRTNYVSRDIYYEILNGISSAANSMWHFDIKQLPSVAGANKNQYHMEVVDMNFCGKITSSIIQTKFRASGAQTPFLSSTFSMDIPGAMKNMIVAERTAGEDGGGVDSSPEGNLPTFDENNRVFAKNQDPVLRILNSFQAAQSDKIKRDEEARRKAENKNEPKEEKPKPPSEEEIRKQNYELFMSKATVVPQIKDRNGQIDAAKNKFLEFFKAGSSTNTTLESLVVVSAWNDTSLFRKLDLNTKSSTTANNILLEMTFDFTIHGVSGIKTGDLFEIEDLPSKYKDTVFQIVDVSHGLDSNIWKTSVTGKMRKKD